MNDVEQSIVAIAKYVKDETTKMRFQIESKKTTDTEKTSALEKKIDNLQNQISDVKGMFSKNTYVEKEKLEQQLKELQKHTAQIPNSKISAIEQQIEELQKQNVSQHMNSKISALEQQVKDIQKHNVTQIPGSKISALEQQMEDLQKHSVSQIPGSKISALEQQMEDLQKHSVSQIPGSKISALEQQVSELKKMISSHSANRGDLDAQISDIKSQLSEPSAKLVALEQQMEELQKHSVSQVPSSKITALEQRIAELQKQSTAYDALSADIRSLRSSMIAKSDIDQWKKSFYKYDGMFERVSSAERKIAEMSYMKSALDDLNGKIENIAGKNNDIVEIDELVLDKYSNNIDKRMSEMEEEFQNRIDGLKMVLEEEAKNIMSGASKTEIEAMKQEAEKIKAGMQGMSKKLMILDDEEGVDISSVDKRMQDLKKSLSEMQSEIEKMKSGDYDTVSLRREVEAIKDRVKSSDEHIKTIATKHMMKQFEDFTHYLDKKMPDIVTIDEFQKHMDSMNARMQSIEAPDMRNLAAKVDVLERSINMMIKQLNSVYLSMPTVVE